MTKTCERCDGYGVNLHQLLRETCRHCEGTGEVEIVCEFCGVALERDEVDICDRCAEDFDRQDRKCLLDSHRSGSGAVARSREVRLPAG